MELVVLDLLDLEVEGSLRWKTELMAQTGSLGTVESFEGCVYIHVAKE